MLIDYISSEGVRILYDTGIDRDVTTNDLDNVAQMYAHRHPDRLPTHIFMRLDVYGQYSKGMHKSYMLIADRIDGQVCPTLNSGVGILIIKPMPAMHKDLYIVVGTEKDLENILIDEVFEEVVLGDCERE
jgi:hypothetical protein